MQRHGRSPSCNKYPCRQSPPGGQLPTLGCARAHPVFCHGLARYHRHLLQAAASIVSYRRHLHKHYRQLQAYCVMPRALQVPATGTCHGHYRHPLRALEALATSTTGTATGTTGTATGTTGTATGTRGTRYGHYRHLPQALQAPATGITGTCHGHYRRPLRALEAPATGTRGTRYEHYRHRYGHTRL